LDAARHKILEDVPHDKCFWIHDGPVVRNIYELADALEHVSQASFDSHANRQKNDFSSWIEFVLGDRELADSIRYKGRHETAKIIKDRIYDLEDEVESEKVVNVLTKGDSIDEAPVSAEEEPKRIESVPHEEAAKPEEGQNESHKESAGAQEPVKKSGPGFLAREFAVLKESMKNNIELFLLGLIIGIIIGKFVLAAI
jgi:hypothetical protein